MAKLRKELTLSTEKIEYLEGFGPRSQSRIVEEALELHKNKDKMIIPQETSEIRNMEVEF